MFQERKRINIKVEVPEEIIFRLDRLSFRLGKELGSGCRCEGEKIFIWFCCEKAKYGFAGKVKCLSCLKQRLIEDGEYKAVMDKIKGSR